MPYLIQSRPKSRHSMWRGVNLFAYFAHENANEDLCWRRFHFGKKTEFRAIRVDAFAWGAGDLRMSFRAPDQTMTRQNITNPIEMGAVRYMADAIRRQNAHDFDTRLAMLQELPGVVAADVDAQLAAIGQPRGLRARR